MAITIIEKKKSDVIKYVLNLPLKFLLVKVIKHMPINNAK